MYVETITVNAEGLFMGLLMNCYILSTQKGTGEVIMVDPGGQASKIMETVGERKVSAIILTHYHSDHTGALGALFDLWSKENTPVYIHALDHEAFLSGQRRGLLEPGQIETIKPLLVLCNDGDIIKAAGLNLEIIHTPGHSLGSMCLYAKDAGLLFSGDTIFRGTTGRTDLKGGSPRQMHDSLQRLAKLPDETVVYPGHESKTSIAFERNWSLIEY